ncbi:hypothetical protein JQ038_19065 [Clostridium botulinum]|nr:hypothetical protein [Clostridium botulinum]MCS4471540.1 hypothetical protein [Clostridium botulinum]MCS4483720.1 hypothetical protein [Clostridium botulinum]
MSLLSAVEIYWVRMLPIHFGVHIGINIIFLILLSANIGKISIKDAISYNMVMMIILSTSEFIGIFVLYNVFKINMSLIKPRSLIKIIYFIPSFTLFVFSVFTMNKFINREE